MTATAADNTRFPRRWVKISFLILICLISATLTVIVIKKFNQPPNIVLITIASLRPDWLGCYGGGKADTAKIDALADQGIKFTSIWTPSPDKLTTLTALVNGTITSKRGNRGSPETDRSRTLPSLLQSRGYHTAIAMGALFYDASFEPVRSLFDEVVKSPDISVRFYRARLLNEGVIPWLKKAAGKTEPFFLWIHYDDPEMPYDPPSPYFEHYSDPVFKRFPDNINSPDFTKAFNRYAISLYAGEITYLDRQVGQITKTLRNTGLMKRTAVIFTSEHGETLIERDFKFSHAGLYEEVLRVPLILKLPTRQAVDIKPGATIKTPGTLVDLYGTISAIARVSGTAGSGSGTLLGKPLEEKRSSGFTFVHEWDDRMIAVRHGPFKLILPLKEFSFSPFMTYLPPNRVSNWTPGQVELYDLREDPDEKRNLARLRPDLVTDLQNLIK